MINKSAGVRNVLARVLLEPRPLSNLQLARAKPSKRTTSSGKALETYNCSSGKALETYN